MCFRNTENDEVEGSTQITVSDDATFKFKIACKNDEIELKLIETVNLTDKAEQLVTAPSLGNIVECLKHVPSIIGIEVDLEDSSVNSSGLSVSNGTIFFSSNLIDQADVNGDTVLEKGTTGGGSIDVFATVSEAEERNDYLSKFDGTLLDPGSHIVVGTIVIRLSKKLDNTQQKELQQSIIDVLLSGDIAEPESYDTCWAVEGHDIESIPTESETTITTASEIIAVTEPVELSGATTATTTSPEATECIGDTSVTTTPQVTIKETTLKNCSVGDIVEFGSYPYYTDGTTDAIPWIVLDIKNENALLISRDILDAAQYHSTWEEVTWANSSLREWMNEYFYDTAFSSTEKDQIISIENDNPENNYSGFAAISGGFDTTDKVFALCTSEVVEYFNVEVRGYHNPNNITKALKTVWTDYAVTRQDPDVEYGYNGWFTRSPASTRKEVAVVSTGGYAFTSNGVQGNQGIRPAIWVKVE